MSLSIKRIHMDDPEYAAMVALRDEVLRRPLGLSIQDDDLSKDIPDIKLIALSDGVLTGCVMLKHIDDTTLKLRAMAVSPGMQGKGIGEALVQEAERTAWNSGFTTIELHARSVAAGFYEKLGYHTEGGIFTEVGIPHLLMKKNKA